MSQWEREAIGERTSDALSHKHNQGERVSNSPFGSRLADDGQYLEPDPAEQTALAENQRLIYPTKLNEPFGRWFSRVSRASL